LEQKLRDQWDDIKDQKRTLIHIPSVSWFETGRYKKGFQCQLTELTRLIDLHDENVEIIFVACITEANVITSYLESIIGIKFSLSMINSRVKFIVPENKHFFKQSSSASAVLYASYKTIKEMQSMISDKKCMIVPGSLCKYDYAISAILNVPLFAPCEMFINQFSVEKHMTLEGLGISRPIKSEKIKTRKELYLTLIVMKRSYPYIKEWSLRIDSPHSLFPYAYISSIKIDETNLTSSLINNLNPQSVFYNSNSYIDDFIKSQGFIESTYFPGVSKYVSLFMRIEPNGEKFPIGSSQSCVKGIGLCYPQSCIPGSLVNDIGSKISDLVYKRGGFGYLQIKLLYNHGMKNVKNEKRANILMLLDVNVGGYSQGLWYLDMLSFLTNGQRLNQEQLFTFNSQKEMLQRAEYIKKIRYLDTVLMKINI